MVDNNTLSNEITKVIDKKSIIGNKEARLLENKTEKE